MGNDVVVLTTLDWYFEGRGFESRRTIYFNIIPVLIPLLTYRKIKRAFFIFHIRVRWDANEPLFSHIRKSKKLNL